MVTENRVIIKILGKKNAHRSEHLDYKHESVLES